jgi:hypothetical protein
MRLGSRTWRSALDARRCDDVDAFYKSGAHGRCSLQQIISHSGGPALGRLTVFIRGDAGGES